MSGWKKVLLSGAAGGGDGLFMHAKLTDFSAGNQGIDFDDAGNVYWTEANPNYSYNRGILKFDSDFVLTDEIEIDSTSGGNSNYVPVAAIAHHDGHVYTGATVNTVSNNVNHCTMVKTNDSYTSADASRTFQSGNHNNTAFQNQYFDEHNNTIVGSFRGRSSANAKNAEYGYAFDADANANLDYYSVNSPYINTHTRGWYWQYSNMGQYGGSIALSPNLGGVYNGFLNISNFYADAPPITNFNGNQAQALSYWPYSATGESWSSTYAISNSTDQSSFTNVVRDSNNNLYFANRSTFGTYPNGMPDNQIAVFKVSYSTGSVTTAKTFTFPDDHVATMSRLSMFCGTDDRIFIGGNDSNLDINLGGQAFAKGVFVMELNTSLVEQNTTRIVLNNSDHTGTVTANFFGYSVDRTNENLYIAGQLADNGIAYADRYSPFFARIPLDGSSNGTYTSENVTFTIENPTVTTTTQSTNTASTGNYWSVSNNYLSTYGGQDSPNVTDLSNNNSMANIWTQTAL